jgi:ATP-binding cassette, subfamily C (CFTR/MRP), member 1
VAFTSLSLFNILRIPLSKKLFYFIFFIFIFYFFKGVLPVVINSILESRVSIDRINKYLLSKDRDESSIDWDVNNNKDEIAIEIENGNFSWGENNILKNINLKVNRGELVALVGSVGSGLKIFYFLFYYFIFYFFILILIKENPLYCLVFWEIWKKILGI